MLQKQDLILHFAMYGDMCCTHVQTLPLIFFCVAETDNENIDMTNSRNACAGNAVLGVHNKWFQISETPKRSVRSIGKLDFGRFHPSNKSGADVR